MPSPTIKVLIQDAPNRSIALATDTHVLILKHAHTPSKNQNTATLRSLPGQSLQNPSNPNPLCIAEFGPITSYPVGDYHAVNFKLAYGTLGLITVENEVFICVVTAAETAAEVRPGELIQKIKTVDFHCLSSSRYDALLNDQINSWPTDDIDESGHDLVNPSSEGQGEHPCLALKKLLSSGTFFYSTDFDVTKQLSKRLADHEPTVAIDSFDAGFLWNSYMIHPLIDFRSKLSTQERIALDESRILTSAIRGFCTTTIVPFASAPLKFGNHGLPSSITIISRLSMRRAGTRFLARGMDDNGNVANFVQTETVFWNTSGICFSYIQVRGSIPLFWEQQAGLLPNQQKISIARSIEATQPAFDKHFEHLSHSYGAIHVINLLSREKPAEVELSQRYRHHIKLLQRILQNSPDVASHEVEGYDGGIRLTEYDFHMYGIEQRGRFQQELGDAPTIYGFFESEEIEERKRDDVMVRRTVPIRTQEGIFRTNCLDCLDRTNVVQSWLSEMALRAFFRERGEEVSPDFWARHGTAWADNGDILSRIYTGTGAINTSFTRSGKKSIGLTLSNARKSVTRLYVNNFADKGRQNTIDMLLGRLIAQNPVKLYDPIGEWVQSQLKTRSKEFTNSKKISILVGTFNLNGKTVGLHKDLSSWLCPNSDKTWSNPEIIAIGFQEIVELSPQQIMSTDPQRRQQWERAVRNTLNDLAERHGQEEYIILQGGQLVGASLTLFVRVSTLEYIKNVEGSIKKTGLSGMAGNKGAVAIRLNCADTSICFVTSHLAAGQNNWEDRNRDYRTIAGGVRFAGNRTIDNNDCIIWFGDFNYRIDLSNEEVRRACKNFDLERLYSFDQLNSQMTRGLVFPFYNEAPINFLPTYKFNVGSDEFDTSEKTRIPAWTDRILWKGNILRQHDYSIASLRFSDHRPVYATFECRISVIDEEIRAKLSKELYAQRRQSISASTASGILIDTEDSDNDYTDVSKELKSSNLPPPSSNKTKWWLESGLPAKSPVPKQRDGYEPSTDRSVNPFGQLTSPKGTVKRSHAHGPSSRNISIGTASVNDMEHENEWVQIEASSVPPTPLPPPPPPPRRTTLTKKSAPALPPRNPHQQLSDDMERIRFDRMKISTEVDYRRMKELEFRQKSNSMSGTRFDEPKPSMTSTLKQSYVALPPPASYQNSSLDRNSNSIKTPPVAPTSRVSSTMPPFVDSNRQNSYSVSNNPPAPPPRANTISTISTGERKAIPPPRPRKPEALSSMRSGSSGTVSVHNTEHTTKPPPIGSKSLLDDSGEGIDELKDWELLKPMI